MRVPLSWLKDFVDLPADLTPEALAERLTTAGLEVGKITYFGVPQSKERHGIPPSDHLVWDAEKIVLGYIHEVKPHPDADRLVLAMVGYGADELEQVVTGAPNLFDYKGIGEINPPLLTPFALEGAEVIDGHGDGVQRMVLKEKKLRGIPNRCMVCSAMELGLGEDHDGIMLLDYDTYSRYQPGTPFVEVLGDVILEVELTPNLARCFSMLGVAREVAALYNLELREPDYDNLPATSGTPVQEVMAIEIQEPDLNPRFTAGLLRNVKIQPSPAWMQWRLKLIGQRPINNLVDVSNYVMFEIGQPTHAFDYDSLKARAGKNIPTIITRLAKNGEELTTLDGKNHPLSPDHLMVTDSQGVLGFGGVMGGQSSEVEDNTTTVLLEAAAWNLVAIRKTISTTKIATEASARFSRGVHPEMAVRGVKRGLQLMAQISGAEATLAPGIVDIYPRPAEPVQVELPYAEIKRILGFEIKPEQVQSILRSLQFGVEERGNALLVTVPDHRLDIDSGINGQADLIEEIARIYGYNKIPNSTMSDALPPLKGNLDLELEERVRDVLVKEGLHEVINYRFTTPDSEARLTPLQQKSSWANRDYVHLRNPISAERTALRQTLLAGLLENAALNQHHSPSRQLFEVGPVFYRVEGGLPDEPRRLGILLAGQRSDQPWMSEVDNSQFDYYDLKGIVETLLSELHIPARDVRYEPTDHNSFHPGRVARIKLDGKILGFIGEVHPLVREAFDLGLDLQTPVLAAELDLDLLLKKVPPRHKVEAVPTQPPAYRDIAVVVDEKTLSAEVEAVIWHQGGNLLQAVRLFDVYRGDQLGTGKKSLAYALTFQSAEETLNDQKVNNLQKKIITALEKAGAKLRA